MRLRQSSYVILDHGLLALASFAVLSEVARSSDQFEFGVFAVAQMVHVAVTAYYRTVLGSWVLTSHEPDFEDPLILSLTLGYSVACASLFGSIAAITDQPSTVIALSLWLIGQPILDYVRFSAIRDGRYAAAALLTGFVFLSTIFVNLAVAVFLNGQTWLVVASFGLSSLFISLIYLIRTGFRAGGLVQTASFLRARVRRFREQSIVALSQIVPAIGTVGLVALVASPSIVGALRGAQIIVGLGLQLPQAVQPMFLAKYAQSLDSVGVIRLRLRIVYFACQAIPLIALASVFLFIPSSLGTAVIGETWNDASGIALFLIAGSLFAQLSTEVELRLRVHQRLGLLGPVHLAWTIVTMITAAGGAYFGGAVVMAICIAGSNFGKYASSILVARREYSRNWGRPVDDSVSPTGRHPLLRRGAGADESVT